MRIAGKRRFWLTMGALVGLTSCGPKRTELDIPAAYLGAQTATPRELIQLVNQYAGLQTLTVSRFSAEFTGGSLEKGYLKEYPRAKGYLVAAAPESIFLNILNPLTSSTVVTMAASRGRFQIWVPRENKYLVGSTKLRRAADDPLYNVRPDHILQALLVEPVSMGDFESRVVMAEEQDGRHKYYTLDVVGEGEGAGLGCLRRRLWIERSQLQLARQKYYDCGKPISLIEYGGAIRMGEQWVSNDITLQRPAEHYQMRLEWKPEAVRLNQSLKESAFEVPRPPGAELVVVEDDPATTKPGR